MSARLLRSMPAWNPNRFRIRFNSSVPERIFENSLSSRRELGERIRTVQESWETSSISRRNEIFEEFSGYPKTGGGIPRRYAALHWACINNAPKAVASLLKHKADRNLGTEPDGHTPLMKAAAYNSAACVEQLLRARCDATATDRDGRTALHHAAKNKATLCVQMLLASGVEADVADAHNQKAVFYAAVAKSKPCVAAISAAMPNFRNTPDAQRVKLILEGKRVQHDDDDDVGADGWGGCFGGSGAGCF